MNRLAHLFDDSTPEAPGFSWGDVRLAAVLAARTRTPGELLLALKAIFQGHDPYEPLPAHMKKGTSPEAALAVLVDALRDALNNMLEDDDRREVTK